MGEKSVGTLPEETVNEYDAEAEQVGLSRIQYLHQCIEAGRTIFQSSGQADVERLRELTDDSHTTIDNDLTTAESNLEEAILTNLPTEKHRALTKAEIREVVFGTEDEQIKQIMEALKKLNRQGAIEPLVDDGYIKTND